MPDETDQHGVSEGGEPIMPRDSAHDAGPDEQDDFREEAAAPEVAPGSPPPLPVEPARRPVIDKPSLLSDAHDDLDRCPNCGSRMSDPNAVVCVACGYDLVKNRKVKTKVGDAAIAPAAADEALEVGILCKDDRIGWKIPLVVGAAAIVSAATIAGMHESAAWLRPVLRVLLYAPLQIMLGVVAVMFTARLLEEKVGRLHLALGRIALAVGIAHLLFNLAQGINVAHWAQEWIGLALGAGIYYLIVLLMFSLTPASAGMLAGAHCLMWLVFWVMIILVNWLEAKPGAGA